MIASEGDPIPGTPKNFGHIGGAATDGQNVYFPASSEDDLLRGLYVFDGSKISTVVDSNTPIPWLPGEGFLSYGSVTLGDCGLIVFIGVTSGWSVWMAGWYQGQLFPIAEEGGTFQGHTVYTMKLRHDSMAGNEVLARFLFGSCCSDQAIYRIAINACQPGFSAQRP